MDRHQIEIEKLKKEIAENRRRIKMLEEALQKLQRKVKQV